MGDKSPKSHMTTKAKSLKEKRADKHAKSAAKDHIEIVPRRASAQRLVSRKLTAPTGPAAPRPARCRSAATG